MTAQSQLEAYLGEFRRRLRSLIVARGAAVLTAVALAVTLVAVYIGTRRAFDPEERERLDVDQAGFDVEEAVVAHEAFHGDAALMDFAAGIGVGQRHCRGSPHGARFANNVIVTFIEPLALNRSTPPGSRRPSLMTPSA